MATEDRIASALGELSGQMGMVLESLRDLREANAHTEQRLREIENKQSWVAGMAAAVGFGASFLGSWVKEHLK
jgi:hypothetical protein